MVPTLNSFITFFRKFLTKNDNSQANRGGSNQKKSTEHTRTLARVAKLIIVVCYLKILVKVGVVIQVK